MFNWIVFGLFGLLILGLILKNIGNWLVLPWLVDIGTEAQKMMGAAIGVGVASALKAPPLVFFTSVITGLAGANFGGAIGALLAAVVGATSLALIPSEYCGDERWTWTTTSYATLLQDKVKQAMASSVMMALILLWQAR